MEKTEKLLEVSGLRVTFKTHGGEVNAVRDVSFSLNKGETLAIVGESGCGKSVTAKSIMRLVPEHIGKIAGGSVMFKGKDLVALPEKKCASCAGGKFP